MSIYDNVMKLCDERGISPHKLDLESGIGRGNVERWKTVTPSIDKVAAVANYFGVSIDDLMGNKPERSLKDLALEMVEDEKLLQTFHLLNDEGKIAAQKYLDYLAGQPEYIKIYLAEEIEA